MITVGSAQLADQDGWATLTIPVVVGAARQEVWYRTSSGAFPGGGEVGLAAALLCAMRRAEPLCVSDPIAPRLARSVATIQQIFHNWNNNFSVVPLEAPMEKAAVLSATRGTACFFSGGVDSFYTALKHRDRIDALIFVHGFDVRLADTALRATVAKGLRRAAALLGKPLLEVETNVRELLDPYADWGDYAHGAALASVALLLAARFKTVLIPSTYPYRWLLPNGSHPMLDPLWSTEGVEIAHDGCELGRTGKLAAIMGTEAVQKTLRVCWRNTGGAYNCGQCEKCLRTMAQLRAIGRSEHCESFPRRLDLRALSRLRLEDEHKRFFMKELQEFVERDGRDTRLAKALRRALREPSLGLRQRVGRVRSLLISRISRRRAAGVTNGQVSLSRGMRQP